MVTGVTGVLGPMDAHVLILELFEGEPGFVATLSLKMEVWVVQYQPRASMESLTKRLRHVPRVVMRNDM